MVDWIAEYMRRVESLPVAPRVAPGDVAAQLPAAPPEQGLDVAGWDAVFADLERIVVPGLLHWQSPNFYGFFPCDASGPAILGELLAAGLGVNAMMWSTSPAATELETRVLDWMAELLALPETFTSRAPNGGGAIQGTASESTLVAMVAARYRVGGGDLVAYTSRQAHSSVTKAAIVTGLTPERLRLVDTDATHAMRPDALAAAIRADRAAGRRPFYVCATVGTTSSTAVDPLAAIAEAMRETGMTADGGWLHVDAAHAGAACICPEFRWMLDGVAAADSVCFNPHKWLLTNFDCDCFWTRDRRALTAALSITPEYLRNQASESGAVVDYRDWQVPLGRRFRALKLWLVVRHYGAEGLRAYVREHVRLAALFETWVRADERFEVVAPRTVNLVCFRLRGDDDRTLALRDRLNASGRLFLTHTVLPVDGAERVVLRLAIGSTPTAERHVRAAWDAIRDEAATI